MFRLLRAGALALCAAACGDEGAGGALQQASTPTPTASPITLTQVVPAASPHPDGNTSASDQNNEGNGWQEARGGELPSSMVRQMLRDSADVRACLKEMYYGEMRLLVEHVRFKRIDLDSDGRLDLILVVGCASQNIPTFVYRQTHRGYMPMLQASSANIRARDSATSGYRDLELYVHRSVAETEIAIYKFIRGRYRAVECFTRTYEQPRDGQPIYRDVPHDCSQVA